MKEKVWTILELIVFSSVFCTWKNKEELKAMQTSILKIFSMDSRQKPEILR